MKLIFEQRQMQGPCFHLTTVDSASNELPDFHNHDYYEIFWIDAGRCVHEINKKTEYLETGDMVLMRPHDRHRVRPLRGCTVRFTNLSIAPAIAKEMQQRYPEQWRQLYGDEQTPMALPRTIHFSRAEREVITTEVNRLAASEHSRMALEHCVLDLFLRCLHQDISITTQQTIGLPDWLQDVCLRIEEPDIFQGGVPEFVRLSGKSGEHLSRECRRYLDMTSSQIVNRARMRYAAYQLRMSTRSVNDIAQECGFDDPGRFYRLFKSEYHVTPRKYRLQ